MAYKVLYRKYRPKDFDNLYGQDSIKEVLIEEIINNKIAHAYIFSGPRGTGKTSSAKIFAKSVNCIDLQKGNPCNKCQFCLNYEENPDIIEIDAASNNGVDEIRNLRENIKLLPTSAKYKVYIIDEVHMLSQSAWNAFLKTLEEPPQHVIFILATTELQKIPITVLSRCQRFSFKKITTEAISKNIKRIAKNEEMDIDEEAVEYISTLADGAMRDALSIFDQVSLGNKRITIDIVQNYFGYINSEKINDIFTSFKQGKYKKIVKIFDDISIKGIDNNNLINTLINALYKEELKRHEKKSILDNSEIIRKLSLEISQCYNKNNVIDLLKIIFLSYMDQEKSENIISREIILKNNNEFSAEEKLELVDYASDIPDERVICCRINNAFVDASKKLKEDLKDQWKKYVDNIRAKDSDLLAIIEDNNVEVVSKTNVIFSNNSLSTSILFNSKLEDIEQSFNKETKVKYKFICLSIERWKEEKQKYIIKSKTEKYSLIEEDKMIVNCSKKENSKLIKEVSNIFDENIIEIK